MMDLAMALAVQRATVTSREQPPLPSAMLYRTFHGPTTETVFKLDEPWKGSEWLLVTDRYADTPDETVVLAPITERYSPSSPPFRQVARLGATIGHIAALEQIGWPLR